MMSSMRGMRTYSKAFTRRLVILISSSRVLKAVCKDASLTSNVTALRYVSLHALMTAPPCATPSVWMEVSFVASCDILNAGMLTPATFSSMSLHTMLGRFARSTTADVRSSPALAQCAFASVNAASLRPSPTASFVSTMSFSRSWNLVFRASRFFFSSLKPLEAPPRRALKVCRVMRFAAGRCPPDDILLGREEGQNFVQARGCRGAWARAA
mmetsp:Transcript_105344/g.319626  ORF Transcript_105344/g.319626 Transcript_105344/m.319626 type:complete len:212 (-) Transcript_105344:3-638(-)